jgi:hypothetical protein
MHLRFQRHFAPSVIWFIAASCAFAFLGSALGAQVRPNPADSAARAKARADSISRADSLALVKELEKLQGAKPDTTSGPVTGPQGSTNPRLLPDISAVGDFVADLSPKGSTQEDGTRVGVREVELAVQAAVDPYFRGDVFLGISDEEGIAIEQAFLTTTSLPQELELKIGRFLMPLGKQNTTHRHDLHTVEYPYVIQRFFGPEGQKGTGFWLSRVFAPLGFYQEIQLTAIDRIAEKDETLEAGDAVNRKLSGLGYSARVRNYWDLNQSTNLELSGWGLTGRREEPTSVAVDNINAMNARQTTYGIDFTFRWRPLQQGLYKSFILQSEWMRQRTSAESGFIPGPSCGDACPPVDPPVLVATQGTRYTGGYVFARYQITQRGFLGARYDRVNDPEFAGLTTQAGSGYLEFFPSEFSKITAMHERYVPPAGNERINRFLLQATFALGPHKPHPF